MPLCMFGELKNDHSNDYICCKFTNVISIHITQITEYKKISCWFMHSLIHVCIIAISMLLILYWNFFSSSAWKSWKMITWTNYFSFYATIFSFYIFLNIFPYRFVQFDAKIFIAFCHKTSIFWCKTRQIHFTHFSTPIRSVLRDRHENNNQNKIPVILTNRSSHHTYIFVEWLFWL